MSNRERIDGIEAWMRHSVARRTELERRIDELESLISPDDCIPADRAAELGKIMAGNARINIGPKPIDWSKVADCVPVKVWDEALPSAYMVMFTTGSFEGIYGETWWDHRSLITGIPVAWSGGECPLPNGVMVEVTTRKGDVYETADARVVSWQAPATGPCTPFDIISFRVTGIADGWTEEVGE